MKLYDYWHWTGCQGSLISDGEFCALEQCTRIRTTKALTYIENEKYVSALNNLHISCVICAPEFKNKIPDHITGIVIAEYPKAVFYKIHNYLVERQLEIPTKIDPSAKISPLAYIAPFNVVIGKNVVVQPFAVIDKNCVIQDNVRICSGAVIAGQSFTSVTESPTQSFLVKDGGSVLIESGVDICSQTHVACGTLQNDVTTLGAYTEVDALVYIGHGTVIGKKSLITGGAAIAGNCIIGDNVRIGINATISNRIKIGDGARVSLGAVVTKDVPEGTTVSGNFAINHQRFISNLKASITE